MGVRFDPDQSTKGRASPIIERVFVKEIASRVGRDVVLQGARIEFLFAMSDGDRQ
jgi:hypothetical protein